MDPTEIEFIAENNCSTSNCSGGCQTFLEVALTPVNHQLYDVDFLEDVVERFQEWGEIKAMLAELCPADYAACFDLPSCAQEFDYHTLLPDTGGPPSFGSHVFMDLVSCYVANAPPPPSCVCDGGMCSRFGGDQWCQDMMGPDMMDPCPGYEGCMMMAAPGGNTSTGGTGGGCRDDHECSTDGSMWCDSASGSCMAGDTGGTGDGRRRLTAVWKAAPAIWQHWQSTKRRRMQGEDLARIQAVINELCPIEGAACWASAVCTLELEAAVAAQAEPSSGGAELMATVVCMENAKVMGHEDVQRMCPAEGTACWASATCTTEFDAYGGNFDAWTPATPSTPELLALLQCRGATPTDCTHHCHCGPPGGGGGSGPFNPDGWYSNYDQDDWHRGCCDSVSGAAPRTRASLFRCAFSTLPFSPLYRQRLY